MARLSETRGSEKVASMSLTAEWQLISSRMWLRLVSALTAMVSPKRSTTAQVTGAGS
jgi:hypothetical protein